MSTPSSTYRLQLTGDFTLNDAAALVDYLAELGVGAVYLSPILQATEGSTHGYDTTDPTRIDAARGGEPGLRRLLGAAAEAGLGVVVDIVPNHLGVSRAEQNPAWWDVLKLGRASAYAKWFDIDWSQDKLLLPVLGDDAVLAVVGDELRYADLAFPLAPGTHVPDDDVDTVHGRQHYALVHWTRGDTELSYRRFFTVTGLAGLRVEDPEVFHATHRLVPAWIADGVTGLRIDHPDGLVDPRGYLRQLRAIAPDSWIVIEKILEPGEALPRDWPVAGTTGYDAMREISEVLVDRSAEPDLTALYRQLTGDQLSAAQHVATGKRYAAEAMLAAERARMARLAPDVPDAAAAVGEIAAAFDVYRSYLPEGADHLDQALAVAAERRPELAPAIDAVGPRLHDPQDELAQRLQQLSGATMAKGTEDTAFYRYARFIGLNEVGGDPGRFGSPVAEFHTSQLIRQRDWPQTMTALSTHDTKRSEDVRARLAVLSEVGRPWTDFATAFVERGGIADLPMAYLLAQTLAGTGPIARSRLYAYAEKAAREANTHTSWTAPDTAYEANLRTAIDAAFDDAGVRARWDALDALITPAGWSNSLAQKLVQLTMPGIPDVYQCTELWDDSLVDPDNRRPVDFTLRRRMLSALSSSPPIDSTGAAKLWVTAQALRARRDRPELFTLYLPLTATGSAADHLIAFDRGGALTVATRLPLGLRQAGGWRQSTIELSEPHQDQLTGRTYPAGPVLLADALSTYPVALLIRQP